MLKCLKIMGDIFIQTNNYLYNSLVGSILVFKIYFYYFPLCASVYVLPKYRCPQRSEKGIQFLGAGVIDGCELPHVGAGN